MQKRLTLGFEEVGIMLLKNWWLECPEKGITVKAELPASNYTALLKAGAIPDPFRGIQEDTVRWVGEVDWIFRTEFTAEAGEKWLRLDGVDTVADIILDEKVVLQTRNAHRTYWVPLTEGAHRIKVHVYSPIQKANELQAIYKMPRHFAGITGFSLIRKPAYHFGWDWGPILPPSALYRAEVLAEKPLNVHAFGDYCDSAGTVDWTSGIEATVALYSPDGTEIGRQRGTAGKFKVENPQVWYANGMIPSRKSQPLYRVIFAANGQTVVKTVGIRRIELLTDDLPDGKDFCFSVNGKRIFAKGANWIPPDSFTDRTTAEIYARHANLMRDAHFNMLRVWGGGFYLPDEMLDRLDEAGILVWHDFMFACAPYPFATEEFTLDTLEEIRDNVNRIEGRACLALWCGNNEIEAMAMGWANRKDLIESNRVFFYETLPNTLKELCVRTSYWASSPSSGEHMKKVASDAVGDTHIWNVWHGLMPFKYFRTRNTRFCSEFGFESLPSLSGVERMYDGDTSHCDLSDEIMQAHQKCPAGNDKMLYYMIENYHIPVEFSHLIYLSQRVQADSVREATEHWRRQIPRCNGSLFWQWNDCWDTASWSAVDYWGKPKGLFHSAKRFFAPVAPSVYTEKKTAYAFINNDSVVPFAGSFNAEILSFDGEVYWHKQEEFTVKPYTTLPLFTQKLDKKIKLNRALLLLTVKDADGRIVFEEGYPFVKEKNLKLPDCKITATVEKNGTLVLQSTGYVRKLMLDVPTDGGGRFEKNFFDLRAGVTYRVKYCGDVEKLRKNLKMIHTAEVAPKYSGWKEKWMKLKINLIPINFANRIVYKFM